MPLTNVKHSIGQGRVAQSRVSRPRGPIHPLLQGSSGSEWNVTDSSHIRTGTEADEMLERQMNAAGSLLERAPDETLSGDEIMRLSEIESKGWTERLGGVMSALEFLDRPRKLISLAARDFVGIDERTTGQYGLDAYADVLTGKSERLVEKYGEESVGRDGHLTFSSAMDEFWSSDDDDPWWDKATRGLVSFAGDVAIDPLTYVTFGAGGVGATAATNTVKATVRSAGEVAMARALKGTTDDFVESAFEAAMRTDIVSGLDDALEIVNRANLEQNLHLFPDDITKMATELSAGKKFVYGPGVLDEVADKELVEALGFVPEVGEIVHAEGFVNGVVGKKLVEVAEVVANRNFGTLKRSHADYIDHVFQKRTQTMADAAGKRIGAGPGFNSRLGEAFTTGGARLGVPFGVRMTSRPLKLTQGAFEDWVGLRTLHRLPQSAAGRKVADVMPFVDAQNPFLQVARRRYYESDSPLKALNISELDWMESVALEAGVQARNEVALGQTLRQADTLLKAMKRKGLSADETAEVWGMLLPSAQSGRLHVSMSAAKYGDEVVEAFEKTQQMLSLMLADSYAVIKRIHPEAGHLDNYVPLTFSDDFHAAMRVMRQTGAPIDGQDLEKEAARLSKFLPDGESVTAEEVALFMEAYESLVSATPRGAAIGTAAQLRSRQTGKYLLRMDPDIESPVLMANFQAEVVDAAVPAFNDQRSMNDSLVKVLKAIDKEGKSNFTIPKDVSAFELDPAALLNKYVSSTASVAEQRAFLEAGKKVGGVNAVLTTVDADKLMHNLGRMLPEVRERVETFLENRAILIEGLMNTPENPVHVPLGMGASVELPEEIANHPAMQRVIVKLRGQFGRLERSKNEFTQAYEAKIAKGVRNGLTEEDARIVATLDDKALAEMRGEFNAAVDAAYLEMDAALTQAYFDVAADGRWGNEMLEAARANRDYLTAKSQALWSGLESQYLEQMRVQVPIVEIATKTVLDPNDPVRYGALVAAITSPIREQMTKSQGGVLKRLYDMAHEIQNDKIARMGLEDDRLARLLASRQAKARAAGKSESEIAKMVDEVPRDKNALHKKPEEGQVGKAYQAELRAYDEDADYVWSIIDAVETAHATDDEIGIIVAAQAQKQVQAGQARAVATVWDTLIQEGIEVRRGLNPKIAAEVEELWRGVFDEKTGKWVGGFFNDAMAGNASIVHGQLDTPHFWMVVADGVQKDWDDLPLLHATDPEFWAGAPLGTHITKDQIVQRLSARVERLDETVQGYARVKAERVARKDLTIRERQAAGTIYTDEELEFAHLAATVGVSEPEALAKKALAALEDDLGKLLAGDEATTRRYIEDNMTSWLEGQVHHGFLKAQALTAGTQVGDSMVSAERAFQVLASVGQDPRLRDELGWSLEIVNRQLAKMPGSQVLQEGENGTLILVSTAKKQEIPPLKAVVEGIKDGVWSRDDLQAQGLGYLVAAVDVSEELDKARVVAQKVTGTTTRHQAAAARSVSDFEDLMSILDDMLSGKATARKLRNFAQEGTATGTVRESGALRRIKGVMTPEKAEELDRMISAAQMADASVTPQGRTILALQDEAKYQRMLFQPLNKTFAQVERLSADLQAKALAATVKEHSEFYSNAQLFLRELTFVDGWAREMQPTGTALEALAKRTGARGEQTVTDAMGDLLKAAKWLRQDGPFTWDQLLEDGSTAVQRLGRSELGFSSAELKGVKSKVKSAVKESTVNVSRKGQVDASSFGLTGRLADTQMDPMVAAIFVNMIDAQKYLFTPEGMGQLKGAFHTFLRGWRANATVSRPSFHFRNAISAVANGFLIGVGPQDYGKIMPDYFAWRQALRAGATQEEALSAVKTANRYIFEEAISQNILSTGFVRQDFATGLGAGRRLSANPFNKDGRFAPAVAGGKVMESMEDVFRLTAFQKYLDPQQLGHSAPFARSMTMMVHFDYQDLTKLERQFKQVAPFFVWTRRNVPLQLKTLMEHPGNLQVYHHFSDAMNDNFGTEEYFDSPLPSFYGSLAMPLGITQRDGEENWLRFVFDPELPLSNLEDLPFLDREKEGMIPINIQKTLSPTAWINYMAELMGPQVSLPVNLLMGEKEGTHQVNAPVGLNEVGLFLENLDFFNVLNAEGADWQWNSNQRQMFDTAFPFFKDFTGGIENTPARASRFGLTDETGYLDAAGIRDRLQAEVLGGLAGGGGLKTQDPNAAAARSYESSVAVADARSNAKKRSADNPFAWNEDPDNQALLDWAAGLTNGG